MIQGNTAKELLENAKKEKVEFVDIRFTDILGMMHHFTMPLHQINEIAFTFGLGIDGSSIRAWKSINESDMLVKLDYTTAVIDPFFKHKTLNIIGDIADIDGTPYERCPRTILKKAIKYLLSEGIADTAYFGPEAEFFLFSDVRFHSSVKGSFYSIDALDAEWNMGSEEGPNLGHKLRVKGGYFPVPPSDQYQDVRSDMLFKLEGMGIKTEKHHHEVASCGQQEINLVVDEALKMADRLMYYKYVVKNVAKEAGLSATFMPKPVFSDNGSGMHTHQSLWKGGKNLFAGSEYANISKMALHYLGGILEHGSSVLAFTNPTTNSYKRLVPGFEAPVNLVYSARNRSASIRIPVGVTGDKARRIEFRTPDPSCCPYLAFAAMLLAGIDGVKAEIDPGPPADFNLYEITARQRRRLKRVPANLTKVLDHLEKNNAFLKVGNIFTDDFISSYISYKRNEIEEIVNERPHPHEFVLYYDC